MSALRFFVALTALLCSFVALVSENEAAILMDALIVRRDVHPVTSYVRGVSGWILKNIEIRDFAENEEFCKTFDNGWLKKIPYINRNHHRCCMFLTRPKIEQPCNFLSIVAARATNKNQCGFAPMRNAEGWRGAKILKSDRYIGRPFCINIGHGNIFYVDVSPQLTLSVPFTEVNLGARSLDAISGNRDGVFHVLRMDHGGLPELIRRSPESERECSKSNSAKNKPKIMMSFNGVYNSPEDDPAYSEKVIAGALFVAGVFGIIIFVIAMERRIHRFDPPQKRDDRSRDGENDQPAAPHVTRPRG